MVITKKDRKRKGRRITVIYHPKEEPYEEVYWDDWRDRRDGQRNLTDRSLIRTENSHFSKYYNVEQDNKKLKKLVKIRGLKKNVRNNM